MADGFLGRWSQRKQAVQQGKPIEEPVPPAVRAELVEAPAETGKPALRQAQGERTEIAPPSVQPPPPPPTLEDVQALTPQSDFKPFMAGNVDPEVKNAAMKKLFADPHFNVMDRMDIYIDDYSQPDPLPLSMLRKMASAQFLGLVEEEKKPAAAGQPLPDNPALPATPASAAPDPNPPPAAATAAVTEQPETEHHADPDLRLQQDHAAGPQGPGGGAG